MQLIEPNIKLMQTRDMLKSQCDGRSSRNNELGKLRIGCSQMFAKNYVD